MITYEVRVTIEGRRRKVVGKTQDEAWARARELQARPSTAEHTVEKWLMECLAGVDHLAPTTMDTYRSMIRNHIGPAIGSVPLADLTPLHVRQIRNGMRTGSLRTPAAWQRQHRVEDSEKPSTWSCWAPAS
jgi:hypothetical protein